MLSQKVDYCDAAITFDALCLLASHRFLARVDVVGVVVLVCLFVCLFVGTTAMSVGGGWLVAVCRVLQWFFTAKDEKLS